MSNSLFEKNCESKIRNIIKELHALGVIIRRENLTRGPSFKVKSGACNFSGKKLVFLDKRLPVDQQLQMLEERRIEFSASNS